MEMRKRTFLKELRNRLENNNCKDIDDVIQYYDELIEDTIDRTGRSEDDVVYDLGPISEIVARVTNNRNSEKEYFERDNKIHYDELDESSYRSTQNTSTVNKPQNKSFRDSFNSLSTGVKIAIGIVTLPIWLGLLLSFVGIIVGMACSAVGLGVAGVVCISHGIAQGILANQIFEIGLGILLFGAALVVVPLVINIVKLLIKGLIKVVNWLFGGKK